MHYLVQGIYKQDGVPALSTAVKTLSLKTAGARWRSAAGLAAILGDVGSRTWPRLGTLQLAAKKLSIPAPGEGYSRALYSLPVAPSPRLGLLPPKQVFRGVIEPNALLRSSLYSSKRLHASPLKGVAESHTSVPQPYMGPFVSQPQKLVGVYSTQAGQRSAGNFGFEQLTPDGLKLDPSRGSSYLIARLRSLFATSRRPQHSPMYETLAEPDALKSVLLNNRVLPHNAMGRELLSTGTLPVGERLHSGLLNKKTVGMPKQAALITFDDLDKHSKAISQAELRELGQRAAADKQLVKDKKLIAAGLAVQARDTGRVLMLQRYHDKQDPAGGMWEFPGGHIEADEDPLDAARREWEEETGLKLPAGSLQGTWNYGIYRGYVWSIARESMLDLSTLRRDLLKR